MPIFITLFSLGLQLKTVSFAENDIEQFIPHMTPYILNYQYLAANHGRFSHYGNSLNSGQPNSSNTSNVEQARGGGNAALGGDLDASRASSIIQMRGKT